MSTERWGSLWVQAQGRAGRAAGHQHPPLFSCDSIPPPPPISSHKIRSHSPQPLTPHPQDATSEAIRDWVTNVEDTHYILGSVAGPHPYPMMVRDFHAVIGKETRRQAMEKWGGKPDVLMACVGGGSNAMGLFHEFIDDEDVR